MRRCPKCEREMADTQTHCTKCFTFLGVVAPIEEDLPIPDIPVREKVETVASLKNWIGGTLAGLLTPWWLLFMPYFIYPLAGMVVLLLLWVAIEIYQLSRLYTEKERRPKRFWLGYKVGLIIGGGGITLYIFISLYMTMRDVIVIGDRW